MAKKTRPQSRKKTSGQIQTKGPLRFAGIDIGGTKIHILITSAQGKILGQARKKTKPQLGFAGVMERVGMCLQTACEEANVPLEKLAAIGVGAPSPILKNGVAVNAPNMGWKNVPLVKHLSKMTGRPVFAENDCNAGTLGEYALGAGKGAKSLVGLFVGTGLGGGIVHHGELLIGENRMAAEVGHITVVEGGRRCGCGHKGCLEAYASKTGMAKRIGYSILCDGRDSVLAESGKKDFTALRSSVLKEAYAKKDAVTVEALEEAAHFLGVGVANLITLLGPDRIVIGGGVFEALGQKLLPLVKRSARAATHPPASYKNTQIVLAALEDNAVALGAMVYARDSLAGKFGNKPPARH